MTNPRKTTRFSVDLDGSQHSFLKTFSSEYGIKSTVVLRALLYVLELDETFANKVIDIIEDDTNNFS